MAKLPSKQALHIAGLFALSAYFGLKAFGIDPVGDAASDLQSRFREARLREIEQKTVFVPMQIFYPALEEIDAEPHRPSTISLAILVAAQEVLCGSGMLYDTGVYYAAPSGILSYDFLRWKPNLPERDDRTYDIGCIVELPGAALSKDNWGKHLPAENFPGTPVVQAPN